MKIAIIGSRGYPYVYSGFETFVAELATRLVHRGHQPVVYCHRALFNPRPRIVNGVKLVYVPGIQRRNLSQFTHSFFSTFHMLILGKVDVALYVNSANGPFGLLTRLFDKRAIINVDGLEWLRPKWKGLGALYFRFASFLSTRLFDVVVTDSIRIAEFYLSEFKTTSVTIAYGADPAYTSRPELLNQRGLASNGYYLVVGRLIPDNNADIIVRGFCQTASKRMLVIVGGVPYKDTYAVTARHAGDERVVFLGYVRDQDLLRELFCNSYAYIHGHEWGGTNPSLLQALASGCCVLALDTPFSREVLCGEQYGYYFSKSEEDLSRQVELLDRRPDLVEEKKAIARTRITEAYDWEKIADQYEEVFTRLNQTTYRSAPN